MITIDWGTRVIFVPKIDTTLIQATPVEIRSLDLNAFRLTLKALENSEEGMSFPKTHNHNTEVLLGGITYARTIEIINGYTVTFEDGQYAVNLIGANSNVGDVVNLNQVSIRSYNSAGLIAPAPLTPAQDQKLDELHKLQGLAPGVPMTVNKLTGQRTAGSILLEITGDDETEITVERQ